MNVAGNMLPIQGYDDVLFEQWFNIQVLKLQPSFPDKTFRELVSMAGKNNAWTYGFKGIGPEVKRDDDNKLIELSLNILNNRFCPSIAISAADKRALTEAYNIKTEFSHEDIVVTADFVQKIATQWLLKNPQAAEEQKEQDIDKIAQNSMALFPQAAAIDPEDKNVGGLFELVNATTTPEELSSAEKKAAEAAKKEKQKKNFSNLKCKLTEIIKENKGLQQQLAVQQQQNAEQIKEIEALKNEKMKYEAAKIKIQQEHEEELEGLENMNKRKVTELMDAHRRTLNGLNAKIKAANASAVKQRTSTF